MSNPQDVLVLAVHLREMMQVTGVSQRAMARATDGMLSQSAINKLLTGKCMHVRPVTAVVYNDVLGGMRMAYAHDALPVTDTSCDIAAVLHKYIKEFSQCN